MRAYIKHGDIDPSKIIGLSPADGWVAMLSSNEALPVIFWVVLNDGAVVGLVGEDPAGKSITTFLRAADKLQNFSNYLRKDS